MRATAATAMSRRCTVNSWTPCDHDSTFDSCFLGEHHSAESCFMLFFIFFLPCIKKSTRAHDASSELHRRCMHEQALHGQFLDSMRPR